MPDKNLVYSSLIQVAHITSNRKSPVRKPATSAGRPGSTSPMYCRAGMSTVGKKFTALPALAANFQN